MPSSIHNKAKGKKEVDVSSFCNTAFLVNAHFKGDCKKTIAWMLCDNPLLGGISPMDMCFMGKGKRLLKIVKQWLSENKPCRNNRKGMRE